MSIFGHHRVRATFYHIVAGFFILTSIMWYYGLLTDMESFIITSILFILDYVAEMYDPNPDSPGPWYTHFHRVIDDDS